MGKSETKIIEFFRFLIVLTGVLVWQHCETPTMNMIDNVKRLTLFIADDSYYYNA